MPFIATHSPELMQAADSHVDGFAPQIYWFNNPVKGMWPRRELPQDAAYVTDNAASYARLCIDMWRYYTQKPLLLTGQAYWSREHENFTRLNAEQKVRDFLAEFSQWSSIAGLNWWHLGRKRLTDEEGAMSPKMMAAISAAELPKKVFAAD